MPDAAPRRPPALFRERDVKAAIRAVRAAGEQVARVEIDAHGTIRVIVGPAAAAEARNPWDED